MDIETRPSPVALSEISRYTHPKVVERHVQDHHVSREIATRRFEGLKQFMVVAATMPGRKVTSESIDSMWHTFLLFTKDYRTFCIDYLGKFIEHEPFETPAPWAYERTRNQAALMFGKLDPELWSPEAKADCSSGCGE